MVSLRRGPGRESSEFPRWFVLQLASCCAMKLIELARISLQPSLPVIFREARECHREIAYFGSFRVEGAGEVVVSATFSAPLLSRLR